MLRSHLRRGAVAALITLLLAPAASARHVAAVDPLPGEDALVAELPPEEPPPPPEPLVLRVPAAGTLTSPYGARWGRMHHGIDIGILERLGVVAAAGGRVVDTGYLPDMSGYGLVVVIAHGNGYRTLYSHLSRVRVERGDWVGAGAWIGNAGCTGWCTGTHLHFELRRRGVAIDPLPFFEARAF